jgi:hypothetical protein
MDCSLSLLLAPTAAKDLNENDFRLGQLLGLAAGLAAACPLQLLLFIFL